MEFEVLPEVSIRNKDIEFILGMPLSQAINGIQRLSRTIKGVEFIYCQDEPLGTELAINLTSDGIRLIFDQKVQTLKAVEVYDLNKVSLRYCSSIFSSPTDQATASKIDHCFGATHPGVYDSKQQVYTQSWRGLSFTFPLETNVQTNIGSGLSCLHFPEGCSPLVSKMTLYHGPSLSESSVAAIPSCCYAGNIILDCIDVLREHDKTKGLLVSYFAQSSGNASRLSEMPIEKLETTIVFKDSEESVLSSLGSPSRVFMKSDDKMRIHRPSGQRQQASDKVDYFYNYFTLGLDILFDSETHTVKKFVLHTNYPGHFDFNIYDRCMFTLKLNQDANSQSSETFVVDPFTKWQDMSELVCDGEGELSPSHPVVLNRSSSNSTTDNPFGATMCYGHKDIIIEVMRNSHIASLTFFDMDTLPQALVGL